MRLGEEVLDKISSLLVEVDKPRSPNRKKNHRHHYQPNATDRQIYDDKHNNRLYNNYRKMKQKMYEKEKQQMMSELNQMHSFRVQNKHSIFLNSQRYEKPIYERARDIIEERQISIEKKRMQLQIEKERKKLLNGNILDDQQAFEQERSKYKSAKKVSKRELNEILNRLTQKQRERTSKQTQNKMSYLKQKLLNSKNKPDLDKESHKLWEKIKTERSLSPNVFQRLDRYKWQQKRSQEQYVVKIRQKETPFKPEISKNSKRIATSMMNRLSLHKQLEKSPSCKCFQKSQNHQMNMTLSPNRSHSNLSPSKSSKGTLHHKRLF